MRSSVFLSFFFTPPTNSSPLSHSLLPTIQTLTARATRVMRFLENEFADKRTDQLSLLSILEGRKRRTAATSFQEVLVLASKGYIEVEQRGAWSDINIQRGPTSLPGVV